MRARYCLLFLFLFQTYGLLFAQQKDSLQGNKTSDTAQPTFMQRMSRFAEKTKKESTNDRMNDKAAIVQEYLVEAIKKASQRAKLYLRHGLDTLIIRQDLDNTKDWLNLAGDGSFINRDSLLTNRNLATTYHLLQVLYSRMTEHKKVLDAYQQTLLSYRLEIDSLAGDSSFFAFPSDSIQARAYLQKIIVLSREISPVDSSIDASILNIRALQTAVNLQVYTIESDIDEISVLQSNISHTTFRRELPNIWRPGNYERTFTQTVFYSKAKSLLTLRFYIEDNWGKIALSLLLVIVVTLYLYSLKSIYSQNGLLQKESDVQLVLRYPLLSSLLIVLNLFQFMFSDPPFLFGSLLWAGSVLMLAAVFHGFISRYWMQFWLSVFILFCLSALDNAILKASQMERWYMLGLAMAGIGVSIVSFTKKHRSQLKESWILYSIALLAILEFASVIANCFGRYNLAKTLLVSGYCNVVIAVLFLWIVRLIDGALALAFKVYSVQDKRLFYINFSRVGSRAHPLFYFLMIIGWLVLFGKNFYTFRLIASPIKTFLSDERTVGDYTFSIDSLLLFFLIIGISVTVSRIVSYFATDKHLSVSEPVAKAEKSRLGSWLLLIRITIITIGVLFAFAAAGIPLDKLAIILGALGVGIGFGLQTLVNNLVSGLIIAFEKPVNVGDVVEVDNQSGTIKSIGFRSSVISTWDGADMVMPNGDLLNSHLINWTLGGGKRRMAINVGIAYDTDLEKAKAILMQLFSSDKRIAKYPEPSVLFKSFSDSAIDIQLYFWVMNMGEGSSAKSDIIVAIDSAFKQHNITIPFPQQDVHFYTTDTANMAKVAITKKEKEDEK